MIYIYINHYTINAFPYSESHSSLRICPYQLEKVESRTLALFNFLNKIVVQSERSKHVFQLLRKYMCAYRRSQQLFVLHTKRRLVR